MEALDRYRKCLFVYERNLLKMVGHDIFVENFAPGIHAYALYGLLVIFIVSNVYTLCVYDSFTAMNGAMFMALAFQVRIVYERSSLKLAKSTMILIDSFRSKQMIVKIFSVKHHVDLMWMINYLDGIYKANVKTEDKRRAAYFQKFSYYTEIVFKGGNFLYFLSVLSYFVNPLFQYIFENEVVTLLPTYLPGIDENTFDGYVILSCYHLVLMIVGFIAASASDFLFTMLIINTPILALLIGLEVEQLNEELDADKPDAVAIKNKLRNILLMHREMTE